MNKQDLIEAIERATKRVLSASSGCSAVVRLREELVALKDDPPPKNNDGK